MEEVSASELLDSWTQLEFLQFHLIGSKFQGPSVSVNLVFFFFVADVEGHYPGSF